MRFSIRACLLFSSSAWVLEAGLYTDVDAVVVTDPTGNIKLLYETSFIASAESGSRETSALNKIKIQQLECIHKHWFNKHLESYRRKHS